MILTPSDSANCQLAWTAPAGDWASWVFINGRHVRGPLITGAPERMVKVPLAADGIVSLEVHDVPDASIQVDAVAPQVVAVMAFTPSTRGAVAELDLPWDMIPPVSPQDQFAVP